MSKQPPLQSIAEELAEHHGAKLMSLRFGNKLYFKLQANKLTFEQFAIVMELYLEWNTTHKEMFEVDNES